MTEYSAEFYRERGAARLTLIATNLVATQDAHEKWGDTLAYTEEEREEWVAFTASFYKLLADIPWLLTKVVLLEDETVRLGVKVADRTDALDAAKAELTALYDGTSPAVAARDARIRLAALEEARDAIVEGAPPLNAELDYTGKEDPLMASYVSGHHDAWSAVNSLIIAAKKSNDD